MSRKIQKRTLIVSIVLFGVSLFTPSLEELNFGTHREIMPGYLVLAWGWNSIAFFHPAWCANITWIVGNILFFKREYRASFCLSILTSLLSLDSYAYPGQNIPWFLSVECCGKFTFGDPFGCPCC